MHVRTRRLSREWRECAAVTEGSPKVAEKFLRVMKVHGDSEGVSRGVEARATFRRWIFVSF